jgi:ribonuclease BN (tRNA processing enzyme)
VDHLSGVVTFGYSIKEEEPPRNIDAVKAKELGVSPAGRKYNLLKAGFSVFTDDGSREVHPSDVLTGTRKRARKVTVVGDNRAWTAAMKSVARNSDVLVHEATLMEKDPDWRVSRI